MAAGNIAPHDVSMSSMLNSGLELEHQQSVNLLIMAGYARLTIIVYFRRELLAEIKANPPRTAKQQLSFQTRRNTLQRRIHTFRRIQLAYMPYVAALAEEFDGEDVDEEGGSELGLQADADAALPELRPLLLPSAIPATYAAYPGMDRLRDCEKRLREGEAAESLHWIRHYRRVVSTVRVFQKYNGEQSQQQKTRTLSEYQRVGLATKANVSRYRVARAALESLDPDGSWSQQFLVLRDEDVRGPTAIKKKKKPGDRSTTKPPSWIWSSGVTLGDDNDDNEVLRIEWCQCRARLDRWSEEVIHLTDEMSRCLETFDSWAHDWKITIPAVGSDLDEEDSYISPALRSGRSALAESMAAMWTHLRSRYLNKWAPDVNKCGVSNLFRYSTKPEPMDLSLDGLHLGTQIAHEFTLDERDGVIFVDEAEEEDLDLEVEVDDGDVGSDWEDEMITFSDGEDLFEGAG